MTSKLDLKPVDRVEILTLQDNTIDIIARDNNEVIQRPMARKDFGLNRSILAEHGFSTLVTVTEGDTSRSLLFDFGFSEHGAAQNAETLSADLSRVEISALSHGHMDHTGGMAELFSKTGKKKMPLVLHPSAFKSPRYAKTPAGEIIYMPAFDRYRAEAAGAAVVETTTPYPMLDNTAAFLGQIPRVTAFEKGAPGLFCKKNGAEKPDSFDDDSAMVFNVRGKGLVVLSGCAHSGIINTLLYAIDISGTEKLHAVMGGFHLSGADFAEVVEPTVSELKRLKPSHIVPCHCTGRQAIHYIEQEMPDSFILNMSGTQLTFT